MKKCLECGIKLRAFTDTGRPSYRLRCVPCQTKRNNNAARRYYREIEVITDIAECGEGTPVPYQCYYGDIEGTADMLRRGEIP